MTVMLVEMQGGILMMLISMPGHFSHMAKHLGWAVPSAPSVPSIMPHSGTRETPAPIYLINSAACYLRDRTGILLWGD